MADLERTIIAHYNIPTAFPEEFPRELDDSSDEDEEEVVNGIGVRRSHSRFSALERTTSERMSFLPGSQRTVEGRANLAQKDEPDPLGETGSVVMTLRSRGIPVELDSRLRNKFMLSSTTFSPSLFLSQAHSDASTDDLLRGMQFLSRSIDSKSASLKVLVETNFERFVRAKATIDNVYTEMRNKGLDTTPEAAAPLSPRQSKRISYNTPTHNRNVSGNSVKAGSEAPSTPAPEKTISKNALRKESEYGVKGIKGPLLEVFQKAEDVWGPALSGKEREANLKSVAEAVEKERHLYELGSSLNEAVKQRDYDRVVRDYNAARKYVAEAKALGEKASQDAYNLSDHQVFKILVIGRMWTDVEDQIAGLKKEIWRRLSTVQTAGDSSGGSVEENMELIRVLMELGVEDNPIWVWLLSRYDGLKNKIGAVVERSKIEVEILRRRLAAMDGPTPEITATFLKKASKEHAETLDTEHVLEFWKTITLFLTKLLSPTTGLLGEVVEYWEHARSFIEGHKASSLPVGYGGQSRKHHRLSENGIRDLQSGLVELVNLLCDALISLFADPPTEDISSLFSPEPGSAQSPETPLTATAYTPSEGRFGKIAPEDVPAPTPKKGEAWEDFAFWPPRSNVLSAGRYLGRHLTLIVTGAGEMAALGPIGQSSAASDKVRTMVNTARERSMRAICEAWNKDAENCKSLEDWMRSTERRDQTKMPKYVEAFERRVLIGMKQIIYFSDAKLKSDSLDVITPPSPKLVQVVRSQFVSSIYKALSGLLENAESTVNEQQDEWVVVSRVSAGSSPMIPTEMLISDSINISNRNIRMILTLSNLKAMRNDQVPQLIQSFETLFSVKLKEESQTIRDVFAQIDSKLFHSYTRPAVESLTKMIRDGVHSPDWASDTSRPDQVRPYVYSTLMNLVIIHTEISTTVSASGPSGSLLNEVLAYLLEIVSQALLDAFKDRQPNTYSLHALMQATLDTEFIAQTLSQFATAKAGEIQSQIYMELDRRTNNEARGRLQQELGEMRVVLKRLREGSRNSFACFKRPRAMERGRSERKGEEAPAQA